MPFRKLKLTRFGIFEVIESAFAKGITEMFAAEQTAIAAYDKANKTVPKIFKENKSRKSSTCFKQQAPSLRRRWCFHDAT